jgi:hypothetical protein
VIEDIQTENFEDVQYIKRSLRVLKRKLRRLL